MLEQKVKVRLYELVERAVEEGVAMGWRRAHKHGNSPDCVLTDDIEREVMLALCEVIDFEVE